ncbi:MAG: hypothetical protein WCI75_12680 [candidate division NC10 bacterium]
MSKNASALFPDRTPYEARRRLTDDLERWGDLFVRIAREGNVEAAEQILGGLVDWMGNGLIDGWLYLPIPLFEQISDLAEELFLTCQGYLGRLSAVPPPLSVAERARHEDAVREILSRARALAETA